MIFGSLFTLELLERMLAFINCIIVFFLSQGALLGHFTAGAKCSLLCVPDMEAALSQCKDSTHLQPHFCHLLPAGRTQTGKLLTCSALLLLLLLLPPSSGVATTSNLYERFGTVIILCRMPFLKQLGLKSSASELQEHSSDHQAAPHPQCYYCVCNISH